MVKRNKGLEGEQALVWDAQNRLSQVRNRSGDLVEQYWYGVEGARVKKTSGGTTTYTFFAHYEEEVTGTVTTAISHYSFGGLRFAVKRGAALHHLHGDHLGSTSLTTDTAGAATASRAYYAYGAERSSTGELQTDRTFTGQKRDATGLMYYNARYYDPALGTFVSPDTIVPDPGMVIDYNRFLYVRGNPLTYNDPSGHSGLDRAWESRFASAHNGNGPVDSDRIDRIVSLHIVGPSTGSLTWGPEDWAEYALNREKYLLGLIGKAGVEIDRASWGRDPNRSVHLQLLAEGVVALGYQIGRLHGSSLVTGLVHLRTLIGGRVTWYRYGKGTDFSLCALGSACALPPYAIQFYDELFASGSPSDAAHRIFLRGIAVHEMAHKIHAEAVSPGTQSMGFVGKWLPNIAAGKGAWNMSNNVTHRVWAAHENWAEGIAAYTIKDYGPKPTPGALYPLSANQLRDIETVLGP